MRSEARPPDSGDSIVIAISQIRQGNREPVELLVRRYMRRLSGLAASRFQGKPELRDYAEDVAISTLKSVCMRVEKGRLNELRDRDELWRLLATITVRKSISLLRKQPRLSTQASEIQWTQFASKTEDPNVLHEMTTQIERLYSVLDDDEMRLIAKLKVDGFSNREIAERFGCTDRTIERRLHRIRAIWQKELSETC